MDELAAQVRANDIEVVVFNCALSPVQQSNLERALKTKVIDRTGLILEIFGARAQTKEVGKGVEFYYTGFGDSSINFICRFWIRGENGLARLQAKSNAIIEASPITSPI